MSFPRTFCVEHCLKSKVTIFPGWPTANICGFCGYYICALTHLEKVTLGKIQGTSYTQAIITLLCRPLLFPG